MFIVFEGIDGCGKTTAIDACKTYADAELRPGSVITTREPGGWGQSIRDLLLGTDGQLLDPLPQALLFLADRVQHVSQVIRPALDDEKMVLCDRFDLSTYAYQSAMGGVDEVQLWEITDALQLPVKPDLYIVIDTSASCALNRATDGNRFEDEGLEFMDNLRDAYLDIAQRTPTAVVVDGNVSAAELGLKCWELISASHLLARAKGG